MENRCFVCFDENPTLLENVCNCNSKIHAKCQKKLIQTVRSHNARCAVCHIKYKNITQIHLPQFTIKHVIFYAVCSICFSSLSLATTNLNEHLTTYTESNDHQLLVTIYCLTTFIAHLTPPLFFIRNKFTITSPYVVGIKSNGYVYTPAQIVQRV